MDVTHIVCEGQDAGGFAEELRRDIYNKTGCNASIGIGTCAVCLSVCLSNNIYNALLAR